MEQFPHHLGQRVKAEARRGRDQSWQSQTQAQCRHTEPDRRDEIVEHLDRAGGKVLSVGTDRMMLSLVGLPARVDEFEDLLRPYGIVELQRTGRGALAPLDDGDGRGR